MRKPQRTFVVEYKNGRRARAVAGKSLWGTTDLRSLTQQIEQDFDPAAENTTSSCSHVHVCDGAGSRTWPTSPPTLEQNDAPSTSTYVATVSGDGAVLTSCPSDTTPPSAPGNPHHGQPRKKTGNSSAAKTIETHLSRDTSSTDSEIGKSPSVHDTISRTEFAALDAENVRLRTQLSQRLSAENVRLSSMLARFLD